MEKIQCPVIARTLLPWSVRIILGAVFLYAGSAKIMDPGQFFLDINNYQILPKALSMFAAYYLPWLEVLVGICLLTRFYDRGAMALILALLGVFLAALCSAWFRGLEVSCGCFGASVTDTGFALPITRDVLLLLLLVWLSQRKKTLGKETGH